MTLSLIWHQIQQSILAVFVVLATVLLVVLNFKNRKIHKLQISLLEASYQNEKQAIDSGIKEDDLKSIDLRKKYENSLDLYNRTHAGK